MKKSIWNRTLSFVLCLLMLLSLAACRNNDTTKTTADGDNNTAEDSGGEGGDAAATPEEKDYSEHFTYSIASVQIDESVDYNNGDEFTKWWENKYNFDWEISSLTWDVWAERLRVWINSGDMPDIATWDYVHGEALTYIDQGLLYKFPDDWKERWPNVAKAYADTEIGPYVEEQVGGTYFLPKPVFSTNKPTEKVIAHYATYIRKDWAEAVGFELKDYYKASELMEFARLVKEKNPGKIGSKLVPIAVRPDNLVSLFVQSNSAYALGSFYKDESGKYQWGPANRETLTGLKLYKEAVEEGLLNPEFYTYTGTEDEEDFYVAGTAAITMSEGMAARMEDIETQVEKNLGKSYNDCVQSCFIIGEDGKYHYPETANFWTATIFSPDISQEKFERYMDMMDYAASEEGQRFIRMGFEGIDWKYDDNKEMVSLLTDITLNEKYKSIHPLYGNMVILTDDFGLINPGFKKEYRDRVKYFYETKYSLGDDKTIPSIDWDSYLFSSENKNKLSYSWGTEYAELILKEGDIEANWKQWISDNAYLIDPVLEELNEAFGSK